MKPAHPASPRLFLYFFRLVALLGAAPFLVNMVDILLRLSAPGLDPSLSPVTRSLIGLVAAPLILVIAGLCIRRAPANMVGWMLVCFSYGMSVQVIRGDLLPLEIEVLIANLFIGVFWFAFLLIPLYFPDGRLYPAGANRWGNPVVSFVIFLALVVSNICNSRLTWGSGSSEVSVPNPLFVFNWDYTQVTIPLMVGLIIFGILIVILRYRGSRELERLQLRWLLFGVLLQGGLTILTFGAPPGVSLGITWLYGLITPIAIGVAVLRYRLYDIDLIIRRTLQYGLLSFTLGLVYFGGVTLLQQVFTSAAGTASPLAVVLSTLLMAVLFTPLRRRVQAFIDRRFYRRKYDAERVAAGFAVATRSEVELEALAGRLAGAAQESLQPESVSLWLRK